MFMQLDLFVSSGCEVVEGKFPNYLDPLDIVSLSGCQTQSLFKERN